MTANAQALRLAAIALLGAAFAAAAWSLALRDGAPARRAWRAYGQWVEASLRPLFLRWTPARYAARHVGAALAAAAGAFFAVPSAALAVLAFAIVVGLGFAWPAYARRRRIAALEAQIDPTLRSIAQTLKATANLIDAFETVARLLRPPMSEELELLSRQHRVGLTIEEALRDLGARAGSRNLDAAVTALAIGRQTGGHLPQILDEIAAALRERMRLEAFIDAKTSEGKAQAWIMGSMPVLLGIVVHTMDPTFLQPMFVHPVGWALLGAIAILIVLGVHFVRKVSTVDA